jgi:hypothetical protein
VSSTIYLEGGGDAKDLQVRCRKGFNALLQSCGFAGRMPRLVASGGRETALSDFKTAHAGSAATDFVAMLIDSEEPVEDVEETWRHLAARDDWPRPEGAQDDQVLFMTTCMETWIVGDRKTLSAHYGPKLQASALPSLQNLEQRRRDEVQKALTRATRNCTNAYAKGERSFRVLAKLDPETLEAHLPSFARMRRILNDKLE